VKPATVECAVIVYAVNVALAGLCLQGVWWYVSRDRRLTDVANMDEREWRYNELVHNQATSCGTERCS
jgi:hypothetical protein